MPIEQYGFCLLAPGIIARYDILLLMRVETLCRRSTAYCAFFFAIKTCDDKARALKIN